MGNKGLFLGIDVGSTASKCVVLDVEGSIVGTGIVSSGAGTPGPESSLRQALEAANATEEDVVFSCSTGYGRHLITWADAQMSELSCHAKGASLLFPSARTVVDIGGQDAKVLRIDDRGALENFAMNDKCAAGTGRFLDVMASIFGCKVSELSGLDERSSKAVSISSTCTVFAESEVISKLAAGESIPDVVAGVHASVVERTSGLVRRVGIVPDVAMTGGVALNESLRKRLGAKLEVHILTSPLAQLNGALGSALYARELYAASQE